MATMPPDSLPLRDFVAEGVETVALLALDRLFRDFTDPHSARAAGLIYSPPASEGGLLPDDLFALTR
jgi:hypothetical protein